MKVAPSDLADVGGLAIDAEHGVLAGGMGVLLHFDLSPDEMRTFADQLRAAADAKEAQEREADALLARTISG